MTCDALLPLLLCCRLMALGMPVLANTLQP